MEVIYLNNPITWIIIANIIMVSLAHIAVTTSNTFLKRIMVAIMVIIALMLFIFGIIIGLTFFAF